MVCVRAEHAQTKHVESALLHDAIGAATTTEVVAIDTAQVFPFQAPSAASAVMLVDTC